MSEFQQQMLSVYNSAKQVQRKIRAAKPPAETLRYSRPVEKQHNATPPVRILLGSGSLFQLFIRWLMASFNGRLAVRGPAFRYQGKLHRNGAMIPFIAGMEEKEQLGPVITSINPSKG